MEIDFSTTFDWVNHQGILYTLFSVGIGGFYISTVSIKPIAACYGWSLSEKTDYHCIRIAE